jgi:16S rRNA processing protein RimM
VVVATVVRPHGLDGMVKVKVESDNPERLQAGSRLLIAGPGPAAFTSVERHVPQGQFALLKLKGIDSVEQAQAIRGADLAVAEQELLPLPDGGYYTFQILGLRVQSSEGMDLGTVVQIEVMPAGDVYLVRGPAGSFYIPARGDIIRQVDLEHGTMTIDDREGLR